MGGVTAFLFTDGKDPVETQKIDDAEEREITGLMTFSRQEERGSSMEEGLDFVRSTEKSIENMG